jgi:hypothetical protein
MQYCRRGFSGMQSASPASIFIIFVLFLLLGCSKEGLDVTFRTIYSSSIPGHNVKKAKTLLKSFPETFYQLGDLVQTITPTKVTAKINTIRYIDRKNTDPGMQTMVELISVNWPFDDARRFADFTNGNTVEVIPQMWGNIDNDGWFVEDTIRLGYLSILPDQFTFEFEYPADLPMYPAYGLPSNALIRTGNTVTCDMHYFLYRIKNPAYDYEHGIFLKGFVFGGTDSTYITTQAQAESTNDVFDLVSMSQPHSVARSGNYDSSLLTPPPKGKSKIITTYIAFNSNNIIQHYAGYDNIPYTVDDVFVLEPKFWDRFNIVIDQN